MTCTLAGRLSRREWLVRTVAPALAADTPPIAPVDIARRHDETVENLLRAQITDPAHRFCGTTAGRLPSPGGAASVIEALTAAFLYPESKFYQHRLLVQRIRLAADYLQRFQSADGNIDLPTTNFNSPPDTGFVVHRVGTAACLAQRYGEGEVLKTLEPFLRRAAAGMTAGGVHTPNHRWVISSALAQIHEVFPDARYIRRINQWLSEGIDLDEDGQWTERSVLTYNAICDRAFVVLAVKLNRPELLEPVRRNLNSMLYLLHPDNTVVAEITRRGDGDPHGRHDMGPYWFPLTYLAIRDGNQQFAALARQLTPKYAHLPLLMEYPELTKPLPAPGDLPDNYEKPFRARSPFVRIRRGLVSITIMLNGDSRFLTFRRGDASVIVRFANAFFGNSQFLPARAWKSGDAYYFSQSLEAGYYQPFDPPRTVGMEWSSLRSSRRRTEVCRMERSAVITELQDGLQVRIQAQGTKNSPLAVEINLRQGGRFKGCRPLEGSADAWLLPEGWCTYQVGDHQVRFGPGLAEHEYTEIRGAMPKLPGPSVYLTGFTPFDHTLTFEWI